MNSYFVTIQFISFRSRSLIFSFYLVDYSSRVGYLISRSSRTTIKQGAATFFFPHTIFKLQKCPKQEVEE